MVRKTPHGTEVGLFLDDNKDDNNVKITENDEQEVVEDKVETPVVEKRKPGRPKKNI